MRSAAHHAHGRTTPVDIYRRVERHRRIAVIMVFALFALTLAEGTLRKWFLPGIGAPLVFLRDPPTGILYLYCFVHGLFLRSRLTRFWFCFAAISSVLGLLPYLISETNIAGWILGVRTYWLYMPLAFIIGATFRQEDIRRLFILVSIVAVPYAALVAYQYNAGPQAWVNRGIGGDEEAAVSLVGNVVRPFGLFTYTNPNVDFTAAAVAIFIALYLSGMQFRFRFYILLAAGVAVGAMSVLTGSRIVYFFLAPILGMSLFGAMLARMDSRAFARSCGITAFGLIAVAMMTLIFPDMYSAMARRFVQAEDAEGSIWDRAAGVFAFVGSILDAPLPGNGIGIGAPGVSVYLGLPALMFGENELERVVNELGGPLGLVFVILRFGTAIWLAAVAIRLAGRGVLTALPLAGYTLVPIALGQITHSPLNAFMPWLTVGLVLALQRIYGEIPSAPRYRYPGPAVPGDTWTSKGRGFR